MSVTRSQALANRCVQLDPEGPIQIVVQRNPSRYTDEGTTNNEADTHK